MRKTLTALFVAAAFTSSAQSQFIDYSIKSLNKIRRDLGIDTLSYDKSDYINQAGEDYCYSLAYCEDSLEAEEIANSLDEDPDMAPYCIADITTVANEYEWEFRDSKDLSEEDIAPEWAFRERDCQRILEEFMKDTAFAKTVSVGEEQKNKKAVRRISVTEGYRVSEFKVIKEGLFRNKYKVVMIYCANIILYIKD